MPNANLHGYGLEESGVARIRLGKRRTEEYEHGTAKVLKGQPVPAAPAQQNLPFRTANNTKWNEEMRFVEFNFCLQQLYFKKAIFLKKYQTLNFCPVHSNTILKRQ